MQRLAIVIPTYTNTDGLKHVLECLIKTGMNYPVVIVNNHKTPLSTSFLPDDISSPNLQITVVEEGGNRGFARASNDGVKKAREVYGSEYVAFVNDDISFKEDWIAACLKAMKKHGWHACTPVLTRPNGTVENVGYQVLPIGRAVLITDPQDARPKDGLTAAALVMESSAFTRLGGFDERLFAYLEDVELFLKAKKHGLSWGVETQVSVVHEGQVTSDRFPIKKAWLDLRNWSYLIIKHWAVRDLATYWPHITVERIRNVSGLLKALMHAAT